jgi:4-hydroxybenzoate polyprenyltransferase
MGKTFMRGTLDLPYRRLPSFVASEIVHGGHLVSAGVSGMILSVVLLFRLPVTLAAIGVPYLVTQVIYTYNRLREVSFDQASNPERTRYVLAHRRQLPCILGAYATLLALLMARTSLLAILIAVLALGAGILYSDWLKSLPLQRFVGFKDLYCSVVFALSVFVVPALYRLPILRGYSYYCAFVFCQFLVNTAFFDLKDIESDRERNVRTFAAVLGKGRTLTLLHALNLVSMAPLLLGIYAHQLPAEAAVLVLGIVYSFAYLTAAPRLDGKALRTLSYLIVDAEFIVWFVLVVLARVVAR